MEDKLEGIGCTKVAYVYMPALVKAVQALNCTAAEDQLVQHCAAPLSDIAGRLEELFQGGQQAFLKNVNNLAPIFAQGG